VVIRVWGTTFKPALKKECKRLGVKIFDRVMATSLLTEGGKQQRSDGKAAATSASDIYTVTKGDIPALSLSQVNYRRPTRVTSSCP
jgi:hypothetical protein